MSFNFIIDPATLESYSIFSKEGGALLKKYVKDYQAGGSGSAPDVDPPLDDENNDDEDENNDDEDGDTNDEGGDTNDEGGDANDEGGDPDAPPVWQVALTGVVGELVDIVNDLGPAGPHLPSPGEFITDVPVPVECPPCPIPGGVGPGVGPGGEGEEEEEDEEEDEEEEEGEEEEEDDEA